MKERDRKIAIFLVILFFSLAGFNFYFFSSSLEAATFNFHYLKKLELLKNIVDLVEEKFVEKNVDENKLLDGAIKGLLATLKDPFTRYLPPDLYKEMKEETHGSFGGLGIVITVDRERLKVITALEGTPAYRAGIRSGDYILEADGQELKDVTVDEVVKVLRGKIGSTVKLKIYRPKGKKKIFEVTLKREEIKLKSVKFSFIDDNIGYISISQFVDTTADDLEGALNYLEKNGMKALILDLRDNPGGILPAAVEVGRKFISKKTIVTLKERNGEAMEYVSYYRSHPKFPLVVLVNGGSASASEIVAGAIKDNKRGILLGEKTFGKGIVQSVIPLDNGGALIVTTAKYYTPSGVCIQGKGIKPDIEVKMPELSTKEIEDILSKKSEFLLQNSKIKRKEKKYYRFSKYDIQLKKAYDVIRAMLKYEHYLSSAVIGSPKKNNQK